MLKPIVLLYCLLGIYPCFAQYPIESPEQQFQKEIRQRYVRLGIRQIILSLNMYTYPGPDTTHEMLVNEKFDRDGNVIESSHANAKNFTFYNEEGKRMLMISTLNDTIRNKTEFSYDAKNRLFEESNITYYDPAMPPELKGKKFVVRHGYSDATDTLKCATINASGDWIRTLEKFSENDSVTVIRCYNPGYGYQWERKWYFNSNGKILRYSDENFIRNEKKEFTYEYDVYGNRRTKGEDYERLNFEVFYNSDHVIEKVQVYDDNGRITNEFIHEYIK